MPNRGGGPEIHEDPRIERRHWLYERVVWTLMALVVLAEILGVFGGGALSRGAVEAASNGLRVEYSRFSRRTSPTHLRVHVPPGSASGGEVRVWIDRRYLDDVDVQHVTPEPDHVELGSERLTYVFRTQDPAAAAEIAFAVEPQSWGRIRGRAGVEGGEQVAFAQIIFP
jgi:hypothetical protein